MASPVDATDHLGAVPVTAISCPDNGNKVVAEYLRTAVAALLANDGKLTTDSALYVLKTGSTSTGLQIFAAGATVSSGQDLTLNGVSVQGVVGFSTLGRVWLAGRKQLWRSRVTLADSAHTISVDSGDRFNLSALNAAPRIITFDSTTIIPTEGETLTFFWNPATAGGAGTQYTFKRDAGAGAATIATFVGAAVADTGAVFAEFEYALISTGPNVYAWRLGNHSGTPNEYTTGPDAWTSYGVIPGAGA